MSMEELFLLEEKQRQLDAIIEEIHSLEDSVEEYSEYKTFIDYLDEANISLGEAMVALERQSSFL